MTFRRPVALTIACLVAVGASAVQQQRPEPTRTPPAAAPVSDPASAPGTPQAAPPVGEADDTAALIAKANAIAAANAKSTAPEIAAPAVKEMPSAKAQKKAREYGFHAEVYSGNTFFCRDDATVGTRLPSKWCLDANEFEDYAVQLKIARDLMKSKATCNAGKVSLAACGGLQ